MTTDQVRKKYLQFFENRGHKIIAPAPLVLENDPTTLFTSSGMQPLVPYLLGEPHPEGSRVVDSQPCIRVQDIEETGDNRHTTFFEMLGNWSFGDYFKDEQLEWIWKFLTDELGLSANKLYVSVFEGWESVSKDEESITIWTKLGVSKDHIFEYPVKKNWWSRSGSPREMPVGEIGGPTSEIFFDFGLEHKFHENSQWKDEKCHPNCDCGRFIEIGNSVFMVYKKTVEGLEELPNKNVDFGGGLERIVAAVNNNPDVFIIDVFHHVINEIEGATGKLYSDDTHKPAMRIMADHIRAASFLIKSGVLPSNKGQGYVLRRLLRRAAVKMRSLAGGHIDKTVFNGICAQVVESYKNSYFDANDDILIAQVVGEELQKFSATLEKGLRQLQKNQNLNGIDAFDLYQTYGFPLELTLELAIEKGFKIDKSEFEEEFKKHQDLSRSSSAGVFRGGLADTSKETTALHTVTHLLHAALHKVLGNHVMQKGSNITSERLRFDFTHDKKLSDEEIKKIERLVNEQIDKDLPVSFEITSLDEAKREGAFAFFGDKYEQKVKVYTIGPTSHEATLGVKPFSREVCGGPHVNRLSDIGGHVTITKEESVSAGVRRLYATIV